VRVRACARFRWSQGKSQAYPGCAIKTEFAGHAGHGYCPSKSQFIWGMRLVLVTDHKGVPIGYNLVDRKVGRERETVRDLATAHPGSVLFCDGGFWGAGYRREMELLTIELITPERHKLGQRPPTEIAKARVRHVIESLFSNLKRLKPLD
jgi:Transposase DDE domain